MPKHTTDERLEWRWWVTPKLLKTKPIHRWHVFPHSFTSELVHALIDEWNLGPEDRILDPFSGAGTTILAAKEKEIPATGYDISPMAVLASRVKVANYDIPKLEEPWTVLRRELNLTNRERVSKPYPELVEKALPGKLLVAFDSIDRIIDNLPCSSREKDFFRLALLATIPRYSRAVATGGWLRWVDKRTNTRSIPRVLSERVDMMLNDLEQSASPTRNAWDVRQADSRQLPDRTPTYSAVITSPPYANRHDYTRVFGVELMFGLLDWEETRAIRYQSFHSHPEARPQRPTSNGYTVPTVLHNSLQEIGRKGKDPRVTTMLEGYFLDIYLCLKEVSRVCKPGAKVAFVLGNAQYVGVPVLVDEVTAEIGEQVGLKCERIIVARYRGNSAQQMGEFGRHPSRESVVVFTKAKQP